MGFLKGDFLVMAKQKKYDRLKMLKKLSREEEKDYGKSGFHTDKRNKRKPSTKDYLEEWEDFDDAPEEINFQEIGE